jgi:hypothetical protein
MLAFLTGCSRSLPVEAVVIDGAISFIADEKLNGCLDTFRVVSDDGEVMWQIEGEFRSSPCRDNFPLRYGVTPAELSTHTEPKPLRPGPLYRIAGSDGDHYYGAFRIAPSGLIINTPEVARSI